MSKCPLTIPSFQQLLVSGGDQFQFYKRSIQQRFQKLKDHLQTSPHLSSDDSEWILLITSQLVTHCLNIQVILDDTVDPVLNCVKKL